MSNDISKSDVSNFFIQKYHTNKLSFEDVKRLGINVEKYKDGDTNDDNRFEIDEICDMSEFYAAIVSVIEKEKSASDTKDEEQEKEEKNKVKDKNGAGGV